MAGLELLEEVVALVVHDDERGEVLHLDTPYGLHAELRELEDTDLLDTILSESRGRASDRPEVEATILLARSGDLLASVALGEHDQAATGGLKLSDIGVHPAGRRGTKRPGGHALWLLRGTRVVDRAVLEVARH